jgi:hypothetical protein
MGFSRVYEYTLGISDWLANNLPVEGTEADAPRAGRLAHDDVVTCHLDDLAAPLAESIGASPYGFALVVSGGGVILGRLRQSALRDVADDARAEDLMEPGPSTFRADENPTKLAKKLAARGFRTAVISTPEGRLVGVLRCDELPRES